MFKVVIIFVALITIHNVTAQTVYTWTDSQATRHFSDTATDPNAESLNMLHYSYTGSVPIDEPLSVQDQRLNQSLIPKPDTNLSIHSVPLTIELFSPSDDKTIRSNQGLITVQASLNRKLSISEALQLMMNGKPYGAPSTKPLWSLKNVHRGSHQLQVNALKDGKVIASSSSITVHLHRASTK
ncbi:nitrogen regulation protein NR [Vibrio sp.]|uniref:nitrogen regulation protein NR n=1 Tax=Vibrio sp. TaxID=678 RepID=UPI0037B98B9A